MLTHVVILSPPSHQEGLLFIEEHLLLVIEATAAQPVLSVSLVTMIYQPLRVPGTCSMSK